MAIPFIGKDFTFTQPDGSALNVRGWGNQYHAVFEALNGFTLVRDPGNWFYQYANVSPDGDELIPTGGTPGMVNPRSLGLQPGIRPSEAAVKTRRSIRTAVWDFQMGTAPS
ncbi:MAG: hypothetical protein IPK58_25150 [Acidobacteria bacterium]|nr:hypothetical protein [Acidobacteriota bacterium]